MRFFFLLRCLQKLLKQLWLIDIQLIVMNYSIFFVFEILIERPCKWQMHTMNVESCLNFKKVTEIILIWEGFEGNVKGASWVTAKMALDYVRLKN